MTLKLNVIQDDAYISYRYVANFLNGDGLVFNIGEHIEGFTNFAWVMFAAMWGSLGADYILITRLCGYLFGAGVVVLTFFLTRQVLSDRRELFPMLASLLVGVNWSMAYWSPAGLETAAFAFFTMLSLYLYLQRNWFLIFALVMAVWIRPEGAFVTGLLILIETIVHRRIPWFTIRAAAVALLISLPFLGFKLYYYGGILPNPFYAKTGLNLTQLFNGLEYAWNYLWQFGFLGLGFVLTAFSWPRLNDKQRSVLIYTVVYIVYIILVGGDFLKIHRFFLPLFGTAAVIVVLALWLHTARLSDKNRVLSLFMVALVLVGLNYELPRADAERFAYYEMMFMRKMKAMAVEMKKSDDRKFSVAVPTIGIFGYELVGHKIIDMVGLTDSTIARHSEPPIPGMVTTWKEAKHNSKYLLESAPDYILFSTGKKPSAPAERALCLYQQFQDSYRAVGWFYRATKTQQGGVINPAFKRVREITGEIVPNHPVEFVENYKLGLDRYVDRDFAGAIEFFDKALAADPDQPYVYLLYQKAFCHMALNQPRIFVPLLEEVIRRDSMVFEAHRDLYFYTTLGGDSTRAALHASWVKRLTPWYWPKVEADVARRVALARRERR